MALLFGMTVVGCDSGGGGGSSSTSKTFIGSNDGSLNGTWIKGNLKIIISGNTYTNESPGYGYTNKISYDSSIIKFSHEEGVSIVSYVKNNETSFTISGATGEFVDYNGKWTKQ